MRSYELTVTAADAGGTVRAVLRRRLSFSDGLLSHLKYTDGAIRRNGESARLIDRVCTGDRLTVSLSECGGSFTPVSLPLSILYEDEDLLIIDKPAGMLVHGSASGAPTLGNAVAAYLGAGLPFHPVQRLDRETSGVMCVAKNRYVHELLRRRLHTEDFRRDYFAVILGEAVPPVGVIDAPVSRETDLHRRHFVTEGGLPSRTRYETLSVRNGLSLMRVLPETGRTHQIRVHFAHCKTPLLGDALYGGADERFARVALHSHTLSLRHPVSGQPLRVCAPLPDDLAALLQKTGLDEGFL